MSDISNPLDNLPPVASAVAWLILTHHKLPVLEKGYKKEAIRLSTLFSLISPSWGYESSKEKTVFNDWFKCAELPSKSIEWQQQIKSYAIKLKNLLPQIQTLSNSTSFRPAITYSRMCLMLADHFYSSQAKDLNWHSSVKLFANTDHQNKLKQQLDEHLVGVAKQAKVNI